MAASDTEGAATHPGTSHRLPLEVELYTSCEVPVHRPTSIFLSHPITEEVVVGGCWKRDLSAMVTTEIINNAGTPLKLKEGNAGVYRDIQELAADGSKNKYTVSVDPNATYREYVLVTDPEGEKVLVTSDDCVDFTTITIVKKEGGGYDFEGKPRNSTVGNEPATKNTIIAFVSKLFHRIIPSKSG